MLTLCLCSVPWPWTCPSNDSDMVLLRRDSDPGRDIIISRTFSRVRIRSTTLSRSSWGHAYSGTFRWLALTWCIQPLQDPWSSAPKVFVISETLGMKRYYNIINVSVAEWSPKSIIYVSYTIRLTGIWSASNKRIMYELRSNLANIYVSRQTSTAWRPSVRHKELQGPHNNQEQPGNSQLTLTH